MALITLLKGPTQVVCIPVGPHTADIWLTDSGLASFPR